jgi:hypothetical protein
MPDFESIIKFFVMVGGSLLVLIGAGFALKALFRRSAPKALSADHLHELEARLAELDKLPDVETRLAELEERVDFAERALGDVRGRAHLPPKV